MALGNFALFCIHVAGLGAQFQYLMLAILVSVNTYTLFVLLSRGEPEVYARRLWAQGRLHTGQDASLSQGSITHTLQTI